MDLNYFPFNTPNYKGKIILPNEDKSYTKEYYNKNYYIESEAPPDIDIDIEKLKSDRSKNEEGYNILELRKFAKMLDVDNFSKLSKKELVEIIKIKLKI